MSALRRELGGRVSGEKAELLDEFITRGQPQAGNNITLIWDEDNNLYIHASTGASAESTGVRMVSGFNYAKNIPTKGEAALKFNFANGRPYQLVYFDVHHNFGLSNIYAFGITTKIEEIIDPQSGNAGVYDGLVIVTPIDGNTVRLWTMDTPDAQASGGIKVNYTIVENAEQ